MSTPITKFKELQELTSALSREKALREALGKVCVETKDQAVFHIARKALEGQPETKEVTRDELVSAIEESAKGYLIEISASCVANHILTHFDIRRKV